MEILEYLPDCPDVSPTHHFVYRLRYRIKYLCCGEEREVLHHLIWQRIKRGAKRCMPCCRRGGSPPTLFDPKKDVASVWAAPPKLL